MSFDHKATGFGKPRVTGPEAMVDTVLELGIVPFFANHIPGYSIEEMTPKGNWFDTQDNLSFTPWDWKIACVQCGDIAYGKFLCGGKAAFASLEWYRELRAWRLAQDKYRPDAGQQKVLDYLAEYGTIGIKEVRGLLGIKKGQADALMTKLQMQCRVITGDITRVYRGPDLHYNGWQVSSFCTPEAFFDCLEVDHSPEEAWERLSKIIRSIVPDATDKDIAKLLA